MAGPQFIRFQTFSQKANKGGQSVRQVIDEVVREPEFSQHVEAPEPPNQIYGITPQETLDLHDKMLSKAKTKVTLKNGKTVERGIRKDRHTLLGCVASHPYTSRMVKELPDARAEYEDWRERTVTWLRDLHGDRLKCVVEHLDETHPHIHAYILPDDDPNCSARALNPAYVAKEQAEQKAKAEGKENRLAVKEGNLAYKDAARAIQDDYAEKVGQFCAMTRTGPKRERLSRQQWNARKKDAERTREALTVPERVEAAIALTSASEAPREPLERLKEVNARKCLEATPVPLWGDLSGSLGPLVGDEVKVKGGRKAQIEAMTLPPTLLGKKWREVSPPEDLTIFDAAKWWAEFDREWIRKAETMIIGQEDPYHAGLIEVTKAHMLFRRDWVQDGKKFNPSHVSHILEAFRELRRIVWEQLKQIVTPQIPLGQAVASEISKHEPQQAEQRAVFKVTPESSR